MEFVDYIVIAIVVSAILSWGIDKFRKWKTLNQRWDDILEVAIAISSKLTNEISKKHPRIPFDAFDSEILKNRVLSIQSFAIRNPRDAVIATLEPYFESLCVFFQNKKFKPKVKNIDSSLYGSESFWLSEENNRNTKNGKDPPDWNERRQIVFLRDKERCLRCGLKLTLKTCHIHHVERRAYGGNHALSNLATLCKDCHKLMEGHDKMKSIKSYYISSRKYIHTPYCSSHKRSKYTFFKKTGSLPEILKNGYRVCKQCDPWGYHKSSKFDWEPFFVIEARHKARKVALEMLSKNNIESS